MPAWLTAVFQLIGLADLAARWAKQKDDQNTGGVIHEAKDLRAQVQEQQDGEAIAESVHGLSDAELNRRLHGSSGPGSE